MTISNLKLYEIANDYQRAIESMLHNENKEKGSDLLLDAIKDSFENKVISVAKYIKSLDAEAAAIKEAAKAMAERYKRVEKHAESLTEYLRFNLEKSGLADPIKCLEFDIKLQRNPKTVVIFDDHLIPDLFKVRKEVITFDKVAIKKSIDDGFDVAGCKLEQKMRLVIK